MYPWTPKKAFFVVRMPLMVNSGEKETPSPHVREWKINHIQYIYIYILKLPSKKRFSIVFSPFCKITPNFHKLQTFGLPFRLESESLPQTKSIKKSQTCNNEPFNPQPGNHSPQQWLISHRPAATVEPPPHLEGKRSWLPVGFLPGWTISAGRKRRENNRYTVAQPVLTVLKI